MRQPTQDDMTSCAVHSGLHRAKTVSARLRAPLDAADVVHTGLPTRRLGRHVQDGGAVAPRDSTAAAERRPSGAGGGSAVRTGRARRTAVNGATDRWSHGTFG